MINGIHHVAVSTNDIERLLRFYCDVLGFELVSRLGWDSSEINDSIIGLRGSAARQAMLRAGNVYLEIFQYLRPEPQSERPLRPNDRGYTHFALDVTDIDAEYARLSAAGMTFTREPPVLRGGGLRAVYGYDPDGNIIELQEVISRKTGYKLDELPHLRGAEGAAGD
jgi:catechol 2,3-dioxygenase-like lactoylglutathione lyase family enzyme